MSGIEDQAAAGLIEATQDYLRRNLAPLLQRVKAIEERPAPIKGEKGDPGERGPAGESVVGEKGDPGERGERGSDGVGVIGEPGPQGEKGDPGERGADGENVDMDAVKALVLDALPEMVAKQVATIPAPERGEPGAQGDKGEAGQDGKDADMESVKAIVLDALPEIVDKAVGAIVDKAMARIRVEAREAIDKAIQALPKPERGEKGEPGDRGRDGLEGPAGRDAMQIEVLPAIDEGEVYRRNTWAQHNGGLWRSFEKTAGMRGWECVLDGFQGAEIDYGEDVRTATVKLLRSSGAMVEKTFELPSIVHRGIWKPKGYAPGDTTMKDGHLWIATGKPDAADEPGTSKMWQLAVRRGRDGKDDIRAAALSPVSLR